MKPMNFLKNFLFSAAVLFVSIQPLLSAERQDLYDHGNKAFESRDYVTALKNLYAFYVINENALEAHPELKEKIETRITEAEAIIAIAVASNSKVSFAEGRVIIIPEVGKAGIGFLGIGKEIPEISGGGFSGSGKEIQDLIKSGEIDLNQISKENHTNLSK